MIEQLVPAAVSAVATRADLETELFADEARAHGAGVCWERVLFSAKESVFKAWVALTGRVLGFEDAEVRIDPLAGTFSAPLLARGPWRQVAGRWTAADGVIASAVVVAR